MRQPPRTTKAKNLVPYTTLFRSGAYDKKSNYFIGEITLNRIYFTSQGRVKISILDKDYKFEKFPFKLSCIRAKKFEIRKNYMEKHFVISEKAKHESVKTDDKKKSSKEMESMNLISYYCFSFAISVIELFFGSEKLGNSKYVLDVDTSKTIRNVFEDLPKRYEQTKDLIIRISQ